MFSLNPSELRQFLEWASYESGLPGSGLLSLYARDQAGFERDYREYREERRKADWIVACVA